MTACRQSLTGVALMNAGVPLFAYADHPNHCGFRVTGFARRIHTIGFEEFAHGIGGHQGRLRGRRHARDGGRLQQRDAGEFTAALRGVAARSMVASAGRYTDPDWLRPPT